jgi:uncharacterized membrane protein YgaE (UPF0421/DUF939 family)
MRKGRVAWRGWQGWPVLVHALRTAVAAVASILVAQLFRLPETYWAAISTLVITQSSLGTALQISWDRFAGTALGALVAALVASYFAPRLWVFGLSIFILGLLCAVARSNRSAYRLGGVTLTIVLLIPHTGPAWRVAFHRFAEVSIGIVVALLLTLVWPDTEIPPAVKK